MTPLFPALLFVALSASAGEKTVVAAFDPVDATAGLQAAIDTKAPKIVVPNTGKPWLVGPVRLESDQEIEFSSGVVILAKAGAFRGVRDALFTASGKHGVVLRGYGASFVMRKSDYQAPPYEPSEWRHAIAVRSSKGVKILGLRLAASGGDGVYIGREEGLVPYSEDVLVRDVVAEGHHRQGMSVVSVDGLRIERSVFKGSRGTDPQAGIDFEPNGPDERLANVVVENSRFDGNHSYGILFALMRLAKDSTPVSIRLSGCAAKGNRAGALRLDQGPVAGLITVDKPDFTGRTLLGKDGNVRIEIATMHR